MHQPCEPASNDDWWRDALMQISIDGVAGQAVRNAAEMAATGPEANAAIWAAIKLSDIVRNHQRGGAA